MGMEREGVGRGQGEGGQGGGEGRGRGERVGGGGVSAKGGPGIDPGRVGPRECQHAASVWRPKPCV